MSDEEVSYRPGDVLAGKYRVERVIGVGGFGAVLLAMHLQLEERVAIKTLLPQAAKNPAAAERFLREARAAVRIRSEHVARVSDVGKLDDGTPYMVMEYLHGSDLAQLVKARGPQAFHDVAEWVLQASEAIAEAHSLGIVHRDLKPANLFLTQKVDGAPCVKVLDFGISKLTNEMADKGMTKTSDVMGSPFYMSPEQMRSTRSVDARCDIWALGAILYELTAGHTPFDAETMTALVVNIMSEPPREIASFRQDVPPHLRQVVLKCLQKDPAARYQDVASLASALAPLAPARAQVNLQRIFAVSGRAGAPASGGAPIAATYVPGAEVSGATMAGGSPASHLLSEQARMTPGGVHPVQPTIVGASISGGASSGPMQPGPSGPLQFVASQSGPSMPPAPAQSWGATMSGKKTSAAPIAVGVGALLVAAIGIGAFTLSQRTSADEGAADGSKTSTPADKPTDKPIATATPATDTTSTPSGSPAVSDPASDKPSTPKPPAPVTSTKPDPAKPDPTTKPDPAKPDPSKPDPAKTTPTSPVIAIPPLPTATAKPKPKGPFDTPD
jgi:eukaryotic-like serine/threonine-protein kinase